MNTALSLKQARKRARLSQRELARRAGVPQSTVARIESGAIDPRVATLDRLLRLCGDAIEVMPVLGIGIDRTLIRHALERSPADRVADAAHASVAMSNISGAARRHRSGAPESAKPTKDGTDRG